MIAARSSSPTALSSCLYAGRVQHRRRSPVRHEFSYRLFMVYLDLAELDRVFAGRWLWSARRPAVAWFRRRDHLGDPSVPLDRAVRDLVEQRTARRPTGPIRLLTHLRYFGCCMNPVSFYYCFDEAGAALETVVAEVHNTPWGERHCYVLPASTGARDGDLLGFEFDKAFHVSPFMPMRQRYRWRLAAPDDVLAVHMENLDGGDPVFEAGMSLTRRPITAGSLAAALARHPFMTGKVVAGIYVQALRLWLKRCPFHPHPGTLAAAEANAS